MDFETVRQMKNLLARKLAAEGTYFTSEHIIIDEVTPESCRITIRDYEHIPFNLALIFDDIMGYEVWITCCGDNICYEYSTKYYPIRDAIMELGYYIGTRF